MLAELSFSTAIKDKPSLIRKLCHLKKCFVDFILVNQIVTEHSGENAIFHYKPVFLMVLSKILMNEFLFVCLFSLWVRRRHEI